MTILRIDPHRPSAIVPSEYTWVGFECVPKTGDILGDAHWQLEERARIRAHMARTGGTYSTHEHGGNCMVCGNVNAIYTVLFHHEPTNTYVRLGQDCAAKVDMSFDNNAFNVFRKRMEDERARRAGKAKAKLVLADHGVATAWDVYEAGSVADKYEESTIIDMVGKLVKYGSLSDRQYAFMGKLLDKITDRAKVEADRAAEKAAAEPVPVTDSRIVVEGTVLSTKVVDTPYGATKKMLVQTERGWKTWGTVPSVIRSVERGSRVRFEAVVIISKDDNKFSFFSRPTKAEVVEVINA